MKKKLLTIIPIVICSLALLVAIYWLIRSSLTLQRIIAMKEDYGENYSILAWGSILQIYAMAMILANLLTLMTFILFRRRIARTNTLRNKMFYIELPTVLLSLSIDVSTYLVLALKRVGWTFLDGAAVVMWIFGLGTLLFFFANIVGAIIKPKATAEEIKQA